MLVMGGYFLFVGDKQSKWGGGVAKLNQVFPHSVLHALNSIQNAKESFFLLVLGTHVI